MNQHTNDVIVINGHVTARTYQTLKNHLMPPYFKLILLFVLIAYDLFLGWEMVTQQAWMYSVVMVLFTGFMIFAYQAGKKSTIKRIISSRPELRSGEGYELTITMSNQGIRMFNNTAGRERNLQWNEFVSILQTDACIALFVRKNNYLMIPTDQADEQRIAQALEMIHAHCPKLKKRM